MKKSRRTILFASIIVVVILLSAGAALFISWYNASHQQSSDTGVPTKQPAEQKSDNADKLADDGDVKGGVNAYDTAIKNTTDKHEQFIYYSRKATLQLNNNDVAGALESATKAYNIEKTSDSAAFVGQIAQQKGDNAMALEYYKKAMSLIDPKDPFADEDKQYYQGIIDGLGGGK